MEILDKVEEDLLEDLKLVYGKFLEQKDEETNIINYAITNLLSSSIDIFKSAKILIENEQSGGLQSLIRLIFERSVYIEYILNENSRDRAIAYAEGKALDLEKQYNALLNNASFWDEKKKFISFSKEHLQNIYPKEAIVSAKEKLSKVLPDKYRTWYDFDKKTSNFYQLCDALGLTAEYDYFYRLLSMETHGKQNSYVNYDENNNFILVEQKFGKEHAEKFLINAVSSVRQSIKKYYK